MLYVLCFALRCCAVPGPLEPEPPPAVPARIVDPAEVEQVYPKSVGMATALSWPYRKVTGAMERGLVRAEKGRIPERLQDWPQKWRQQGVTVLLGGTGEGSGFGGGVQYDRPFGESNNLRLIGLWTFKNYQEGSFQWSTKLPANTLFLEGSYLWRPQENYYGQGHNTWRTWRTSYALRQSWAGGRWEAQPLRRIRFGLLQRWSWNTATAGYNFAFPTITGRFPYLPGYQRETRLSTSGTYIDLDGLKEEYSLGGSAHLGASYNRSFAGGQVEYLSIEAQAEGRTPIKRQNSVLVGLAGFQLNRPFGGSDPIPFYLQPHIGGSSTLRGYGLDRFYGPGLIMASLEYRIRVHPNIQFYPFFDEGQIFERTSDLRWLDWHRNYGFGIRIRSRTGTILTTEFGWGGEGTQFHLLFGTREPPLLRGPVRYGVYRR